MKNVKQMFKVVSSLVLIIALVLFSTMIAFAEPDNKAANVEDVKKEYPQQTNQIKMTDANKNKLFDNLEEKMVEKSEDTEMPVIIIFNEKVDNQGLDDISKKIGKFLIKHKYEIIPGIAATLNKGQINALSKLDIVKQIEYDEPVSTTIGTASTWFGVAKAKTDFGVDGDRNGNPTSYTKDDLVIAVIDTGIDGSHVDLDGGKIIGWKDYVNSQTTPYDDNGHGTHVSSIAAGTGEGNSSYKGVAPGAALVGVKVLDSTGNGTMSNVTAGIDWVVQNKAVYGIEIINLSLGTTGSSDGTDSTSLAVNSAVNNGIVVCVAAGNSGPAKYTIGSPGAAEKAITVAAMADVGELGFNLAGFSSRGPTADGRTKPDVAAPGFNITAAKTNTTNQYITYSGTSMATPFTAGTVALMLDANINLTPTNIKDTIMNTSKDWGIANKDIEYGMGRLDGYEAIKSAGGYTGTNITVPSHYYASEDLPALKRYDNWTFSVNNTSYPIAVTLIIPNWAVSGPDFDIYLYSPSGALLKSSLGTTRQETITYTPTQTGTYTLKAYSYKGSGSYFFDISVGGGSLTLAADDL